MSLNNIITFSLASLFRNSRLINGNLQKEKQLLVEEQRLCRARSRKFFLETQRRRKALEERRKRWDVHEQRLIEDALQQRRQKVQEATERFQRAHLPPSQRHRQSCKKNVPTLDDALHHIQGSSRFDNRQSSFGHLSSPTLSSKTSSQPSPHHALSAVEAYTQLLQERSLNSLRENRNITEPLEKPGDCSPQEDSLSDCIHSESISSKDSLDSEEPKNGTKYFNSLSPAFLLDSNKCLSDAKKHFYQPDYPTETLVGDALTQFKNHELKLKKQIDVDLLKSKSGNRSYSWVIAKHEKTPKNDCSVVKLTQNSTNDTRIVSARTPHTKTEPDTPFPKQESALDLRQPKANDDRQLIHSSATEVLLPTKNGNGTDYLFGASKPNVFLNNCTMDYTCQEGALEQAGKDNLCVSSRKELSASINNLNKISDSDDKAEKKKMNTELIHRTCLNCNNTAPNSYKCLRCCEQQNPASSASFQRTCGVRFIKGILKKQSKFMSGDVAFVCNPGQMTLTKQVALAIRDSVELTRAKNRALENSSAVKKKLRWFDEVHVNREDKGQITIKQICSKSSSQLHSKNHSEDHQLSIGSIAGAIKAGPDVTRTVPNGYHFTRNAWADVGVQVSLPQQHGDEVKVQHRNNKSGGLKTTTKERVEAAPVSSRTRKGTYIRPQSATEVSQIARAHGRLVMPRPPPPRTQGREEQKGFVITAAPYGTDHAKINCRPAEELVLQREEVNTCYPVYTNNEGRADNGLLFTPHPPSYTCANTDGNTSSKSRLSHHGPKAGMEHNDKSSSLKCTPTEEEISQLWFGVRTALATKDAQVALRHQVVESTHNERRKSAPLAVRKLPHSASPSKRTLDPDSFRFGRMNKDETQNDGRPSWEDTQISQRSETFHQQHQPGFTTISMEEDRILQSLDRLNHRLYYVQDQHSGEDRAMGFLNQYTANLNATSPQKLHTGPYQSQTQKRL